MLGTYAGNQNQGKKLYNQLYPAISKMTAMNENNDASSSVLSVLYQLELVQLSSDSVPFCCNCNLIEEGCLISMFVDVFTVAIELH